MSYLFGGGAAFPPHLQQTFSRQVLHPGSSVSLKCVASGIPPPHWTWMLDDSPLPVSERYFLGQQQQTGVEDQVVTHLNISHVRIEDGGHYKVRHIDCFFIVDFIDD